MWIGPGVKDIHSHVCYAFSKCVHLFEKEDFGISLDRLTIFVKKGNFIHLDESLTL